MPSVDCWEDVSLIPRGGWKNNGADFCRKLPFMENLLYTDTGSEIFTDITFQTWKIV